MTHSNSRGIGADNPRAKMTNQDARELRILRAVGYTYQQLQDTFGLSPASVNACLKGKSYRDAGGPVERSKAPVV